jgi:hypothetical protein
VYEIFSTPVVFFELTVDVKRFFSPATVIDSDGLKLSEARYLSIPE